MHQRTKHLVIISFLVAAALILHVVERLLPVPQLAPGVKLGLANIVTLFAVYSLPAADAAAIVLLRTTLGSLLGGGVTSFFFSLTGGMVSLVVMLAASKAPGWFSLPAVSVLGALAHNAGQLFVASLIVGNFALYSYLPVLIISGGITGIFVGFAARLLLISWERTGLASNLSFRHYTPPARVGKEGRD